MNKKILLSLGAITMVTAAVINATGAFFTDTETSTGNTFTAGALDLRVDATAHYNHMICVDGEDEDSFGDTWQPEPGFFGEAGVPADHYPQPGMPCNGTWAESDLLPGNPEFRFFDLTDVKPGDEGENTISLHVLDNDAWGCFLVDNVSDLDVSCTEPESESTDPECSVTDTPGPGELAEALTFDAWLDEGGVAGFQCNNPGDETSAGASCTTDPLEGDNILNGLEVLFWDNEIADQVAEGPFAMSEILSAAYTAHACSIATGDTDFAACHGLAQDGRLVGAATYYWGLAWNIPAAAGNEMQTDALSMDMAFEVAQHRNNPNFTCTTPEQPVVTRLTLAKTVTPPQAGLDSAFTLTATGPTVGLTGTENAPAITAAVIQPGVYTLTETGVPNAGFTSVSSLWDCTGNVTPEIDNANGTATVTVAAGETVVCGVTNAYTETIN
jgi:hypothetical protein